jgi:hypothetical protein
MSNVAFPNDAGDTPVLTPGWTAQKGPAGDQNLTGHAGVTPLSFIAQATDAATTQAAVNSLLTELIAAGWMKSS